VPSQVIRQRAVESSIGEELVSMCVSKKPVADVQTAIEQRVGKLLASVR
jgi:hypothetical protein